MPEQKKAELAASENPLKSTTRFQDHKIQYEAVSSCSLAIIEAYPQWPITDNYLNKPFAQSH